MGIRSERRWRLGLTAAAACVAAVMLVTAFQDVNVRRTTPTREWGVALARAGVYAFAGDTPTSRSAGPVAWRVESARVWGSPRVLLVPGWVSQPVGGLLNSSVRVPLWPVLLVLGGGAGWMWRRRATWPEHLCRECRYDLSGTKGSTCPECGAATGR